MKQSSCKKLEQKIYSGKRISPEDALSLFSWDLIDLSEAGDMRRKLVFPKEEVGFIIDRIINFTNICEAACNFCAYHARANLIKPFELTQDEICAKINELVSAGGTQVMLQGGLHPDYTLYTYVSMVRNVKKRFPQIYLHSFSPSEIVHMANKSSLSIDETILNLKNAGLDSVPGASDLLVDRIRKKVSPRKIGKDLWCEVIYSLHRHGMKSSATMTYGMGETNEEKIEHLKAVRDVQDKTGILRAFIPWSFSPARTGLKDIEPATGIDYLKIVAIARIFLDNITYIQAGWLTEGLKLAQLALTTGANDMGGVLMEETVVKATGIETKAGIDEFIDIIKNAGKKPVLRDSGYKVLKKYKSRS
ncbi:MAG: CofH family radical SAM protein [Desulfobacteraceae bacterium]|nr:MAG: CofH family radical SAM protein [Desulfobacteraceae bacterium]